MSEAELFERRREIVGVGVDAEGRRVVLLERNSGELEEEVAEAFGDVETKVVGKVKLMVFEEELPRPLEAYRGEKVVPLIGGVSYGLLRGPTGTMGAVVYDRYTNRPMLLSASHVVGIWGRKRLAHAGSPTISPGEADGGDPEDVVGSLRRWTDTRVGILALADASASHPIVPVKGEIAGIGKVEGWAEPEVGMSVSKSGRTSGVTEGRIELVNATVRVDGGEAGVVTFVNQVVTDRPMMLPGDSGSAFLDEENRIVALGFAGSDKISIATPISTVCRLLDVLPTPRARMEPVPTPLLKSLVLSAGIYGVVKLYELMKVRKWAG